MAKTWLKSVFSDRCWNKIQSFNSLQTWSSTKPLSKLLMMISHQSHPKEQASMTKIVETSQLIFIDKLTLQIIIGTLGAILSRKRRVNEVDLEHVSSFLNGCTTNHYKITRTVCTILWMHCRNKTFSNFGQTRGMLELQRRINVRCFMNQESGVWHE